MADNTHREALLKEGQFLPGVSPPPYEESEMSGAHSRPYAPNQQPGYAPYEPKTLSPPSAPPEYYSGPNMTSNTTAANLPVPVNGPPMANTAVNVVMPTSPAVYPGPIMPNTLNAVNFSMPAGAVPVGPKSMQMRCFHCQAFISTKTTTSAKSSAHFACCLLFFLSCGICSCIPYCMGSCRRVDHSCPNCGSFLGSYNP